jgi:hypothetical protein
MCAASCALIATGSAWAAVEVMYCQITGHPKAVVPSGAGLAKGTEFKVSLTTGFDRPFASPDGTKFFFTGLANLAIAEDECYIVWDNGSASTVAREGTNFGSPTADLLGTGDQRMGINNAGQFVFGTDTNAATTVDRMIVKWDGASFVLVAREGDVVPGAATELWGNGLNSGHILADGTGVFCGVDTNGTLPGVEDDFCMMGNTILIQTGNAIEGAAWDAFNSSDFWVTPDGAHWMMVGDDTTATTQDRIVAVDGVVVIREGTPLPDFTSNVNALGADEQIFLNDGSWMARGNNVDGHDWVLRNGTVIAQKGRSVATSTAEVWDDTTFSDLFFFIAGNAVGDYVVGGLTDEADLAKNAVLVLNGETVVAREGDMIDLNGDGMANDDAFISVFNNDDGFLTDDLKLVFFANCVNGAAASIGQMVLMIDLGGAPPCPADVFETGGVDLDDLLAVINSFGLDCSPCTPTSCPADVDDDCDVDLDDLLYVINSWGPCP